jgi:hypothetical protein
MSAYDEPDLRLLGLLPALLLFCFFVAASTNLIPDYLRALIALWVNSALGGARPCRLSPRPLAR